MFYSFVQSNSWVTGLTPAPAERVELTVPLCLSLKSSTNFYRTTEWFELEGTLKITFSQSPGTIFYICILSFDAVTWVPGSFVLFYYTEASFRAGFSRVSQLQCSALLLRFNSPKTHTGIIFTSPCWGLCHCSEIILSDFSFLIR